MSELANKLTEKYRYAKTYENINGIDIISVDLNDMNVLLSELGALQAAEKERDEWKAEAELQRLLFTDEFETALRYMRERDELRKRVELTDKAIVSALGLIADLENELIGIKNVAVSGMDNTDSDRMKAALTAIKWAVESVIYDKEPEDEQN